MWTDFNNSFTVGFCRVDKASHVTLPQAGSRLAASDRDQLQLRDHSIYTLLTWRHVWCSLTENIDCKNMNNDRDDIMLAPACAKRCVTYRYCAELSASRVLRMMGDCSFVLCFVSIILLLFYHQPL